ncbi:SMI1/KNR4 family protein, partial [Pseudomonas sp. MWU13-2625]
MEEVIEQLREANEPVPVPLELPDEDQLVEIEEQLFINIPFVFKEFLLTVSDVVYGSLEHVTVNDPQSHTY